SGSFTTALLRALHAHARGIIHPRELAEQACLIEIEKLGEPIGKQDQYIAAFGGITCFTFRKDGTVEAAALAIDEEIRCGLEDNLLLFFTRFSGAASEILRDQDSRPKGRESAVIDNVHYMKAVGLRREAE